MHKINTLLPLHLTFIHLHFLFQEIEKEAPVIVNGPVNDPEGTSPPPDGNVTVPPDDVNGTDN